MKITIKTKNIQVDQNTLDYVEKKLQPLDKHTNQLNPAPDLVVEIGKESNHHKQGDIFFADLSLQVPGKILMAKSVGDDLLKTVVETREQLEGEVRKYKEKLIDEPRRKSQHMDETMDEEAI